MRRIGKWIKEASEAIATLPALLVLIWIIKPWRKPDNKEASDANY